MNKKKSYKISIIGGGITGCASALLLARLGHKVTLFEKSGTLGGAIKDIIYNNNFFF